MHPSRSCEAISRFILAGVEIGYPDAVEIHRRRAKRQDIPNTLGRKIRWDVGYRECLRDNALLLSATNSLTNLEYVSLSRK